MSNESRRGASNKEGYLPVHNKCTAKSILANTFPIQKMIQICCQFLLHVMTIVITTIQFNHSFLRFFRLEVDFSTTLDPLTHHYKFQCKCGPFNGTRSVSCVCPFSSIPNRKYLQHTYNKLQGKCMLGMHFNWGWYFWNLLSQFTLELLK